jgi:serine/threonine protein kinase/TolB-like protein
MNAALTNRYVLERELSRGGMATVYLARDARHRRSVAIKVLNPELSQSLGAERFLREIELAANLQHPHVVPLFDSGESAGLLYYVMPYVDGESLRDRLVREGPLALDQALRLTREVAEALDYAHEQGIVHRDVKPENILLSRGHALVADFGVARALAQATEGHPRETLTQTGLAVGTPAYMSPEQAAGDRDVGRRSDVYSLGCVAYEVLTGVTPFTGTSAEQMAKRFRESPPAASAQRGGLPAPVDAVLAKALSLSPADRFPTPGDFAHALEAAGSAHEAAAAALSTRNSDIDAAVESPIHSGSSGRSAKAWPRRVVAAALLSVAVAVGAVALNLPRRSDASADRPVLVAPFENGTGDQALAPLGDMAADWITQGLQRSGLVPVVDSRSAIAATRSPERPGGVTLPQLRDLARKTRARVLVSGTYYREADTLRVQARIIDAETGQLLVALQPVTGTTTRPVAALELVRQRVAGALAGIYDVRLAAMSRGPTQAPTYDAYLAFIQGMDADDRDDWAEASRRYLRAYALDSSFTQAALSALVAYMNAGDAAHRDSLASALANKRERMTPFDRAILDVVQAVIKQDWPQALSVSREMVRLAPANQWGLYNLAVSLAAVNRPREAAAVWARVGLDRGMFANSVEGHAQYAFVLHQLGNYGEELRLLSAARARSPSDFSVLCALARAAAAARERERAMALADTIVRQPQPVAGGLGAYLILETAAELRAHGDSVEARALGERAVLSLNTPGELRLNSRDDSTYVRRLLWMAGRYREAAPFIRALAGAEITPVDGREIPRSCPVHSGARRRGDRGRPRRRLPWSARRA